MTTTCAHTLPPKHSTRAGWRALQGHFSPAEQAAIMRRVEESSETFDDVVAALVRRGLGDARFCPYCGRAVAS